MTDPFRVDPDVLHRAATRFADLSGDAATAELFVDGHRTMDAGGGLVGLVLARHTQVEREMSSVQTAGNMLGDWSTNYTDSYLAYRKGEQENLVVLRRVWAELPDDPTDHHPYVHPPGSSHGSLGSELPSGQLHEPVQLDSELAILLQLVGRSGQAC